MKKKSRILVGGLATLLLLTGCGKVAKLDNGQDAVVNLSNGGISINDLYTEMKDKYAINVLVDMIDTKILNEKYPTNDEETNYITSEVNSMKGQFETEAEFVNAIQQYFGVTDEAELRTLLSLDYKRNKAIEDYVKGTFKDSDVQKYYDSTVIGDMKISHILIKPVTNDGMTAEQKTAAEQEAKKKAEEIITKLKNGEDFATLAKENSDDTGSAEDGGNIGFVNRNSNLDNDFLEGAIKLEVGKYSTTPVKSSFGYHIIYKVEQKDKPSLDSLKDDIRETLANEKLSNTPELKYTALKEVRKAAGLKFEDDSLRLKYETLMDNLIASAKESAKN